MKSRPCKRCKAPLVFVRMTGGKTMPCDAKVLTVVTDKGQVVRGRQSHFATCPQAEEFRKKTTGS